MNKVKIAFLGCGRVAEHYKNILKSGIVKNFEIIALCDLQKDKAKNFSDYFKCKIFSSYKEMLNNTNPDLVIILTPSSFHYEQALYCLENKFNTLIEKPPSLFPSQIEHLDKISNNNNVIACAAYQNRLNPAVQCLKDAIINNRFGKIVTSSIRLRWCRYNDYYQDDWHGQWAKDGGVINQQAIHHLDTLCWLLGPINKVSGIAAKRLNKLEAEDTLVSIVEFIDGSLCTIEATTAARPKDFEASISVVAEKGMAQIGGIALNKIYEWNFIDSNENDTEIPSKYSQEVESGYGKSHGPLLQKIIDGIINKNQISPIPLKDTIKTCELVHAIYKSDEIKGWVYLKDKPLSSRLGVFDGRK